MDATVIRIAMLLSVAMASETCPLVIGQTFLASSTDPLDGSTPWALISHGIAEKLFTVDSAGDIVGQVAKQITKLNASTWEVKLKPGYKFSDGTLVTGSNVAEAMTQINENNAGAAQASVGALTWTALDSERLRVVTERETPAMSAVLAEWCFPVFLQKDGGEVIFTGPFAVETFVAGDRFELIPNPEYPDATARSPIIIRKFSSGQSVADALANAELDMGFHLPATSLDDMRNQEGITVKSFEVGYHYMMWHNMLRSPLSEKKVRQAVDLALDRSSLTQTLLGGDATRSLFPENTPWFRTEDEPHADKSAAEALLDEAGWVKDNSGKRMKGGVELELTVVAYPQRPGLVLMLPVVEQTLTDLGIKVNAVETDGSSWNELDSIMADGTFDLLMWAQNTLPAGDPQWFLNAFFRSDGGNNYAGLNSSVVDAKLDALYETDSRSSRVIAAMEAHNAILEEVPVSNLMTPSWHVGLSDRLSSYTPWGSDYYVIRDDTEPASSATDKCITTTTPEPSPSQEPPAPTPTETSETDETLVNKATCCSFGQLRWAAAGALALLSFMLA